MGGHRIYSARSSVFGWDHAIIKCDARHRFVMREENPSPHGTKTIEEALLEGGSERTHEILREYSHLFSKLKEFRYGSHTIGLWYLLQDSSFQGPNPYNRTSYHRIGAERFRYICSPSRFCRLPMTFLYGVRAGFPRDPAGPPVRKRWSGGPIEDGGGTCAHDVMGTVYEPSPKGLRNPSERGPGGPSGRHSQTSRIEGVRRPRRTVI